MTKNEHLKYFVNQYTLLEKDFINSIQFVAFEQDNFRTYSNVFLKLILQIGSEVDNLMRNICQMEGRTTITDYAEMLQNRYPSLKTQRVIVRESQIELAPFEDWNIEEASQSLQFWNAYNEVKHDRVQNYKLATLENVSLGLSGLFVLNSYYSKDLYNQNIEEFSSGLGYDSQLFILENWVEHFRPSKVKPEVPLMDDESGEMV